MFQRCCRAILAVCVLSLFFTPAPAFSEPGNVDAQNDVTLEDVITALQVCAGMSPDNVDTSGDVDGDDKVGLAEAIYALKVVAQNTSDIQVYTGRIPGTGQTKCYNENGTEVDCAGTGQSGEYLVNAPSYTKIDASGNDCPIQLRAGQW